MSETEIFEFHFNMISHFHYLVNLFTPNKSILHPWLLFIMCLHFHVNCHTFIHYDIHRDNWMKMKSVVSCWASYGKWEETNGAPQITYDASKLHCNPRDISQVQWCGQNIHEIDKYAWVVNHTLCEHKHSLQNYNDTNMASLLKRTNVLLVGDSLSMHYYVSLLYALNSKSKECIEENGDNNNVGSQAHIFDDINIYSIRNDHLVIPDQISTSSRSFEWVPIIQEKKIDVLILNRGAHWVNDELLIKGLETTFNYLKTNFPNVTIIYRSSGPGHFNQNNFSGKPLKYYNKTNGPEYYHFADTEWQNHLTKKLIHEHYPWILYIDMYPSISLRGDHHQDPLHYCIYSSFHNLLTLFIYNALKLAKNLSINT